jgi:branched-subunit amino acid aminotransferase/4-amino-4-deoxychorismate lyase
MLGVRPEHLSRVENGHTATFGAPADRLTRAIAAMTMEEPDAAREVLLKAAVLASRTGRAPRPVTLVAGRRWKRAA